MSACAFVLVDAILPVGNHTISEYLRSSSPRSSPCLRSIPSPLRRTCRWSTFPAWIAVLLLSLYPFWFAAGFEYAKRHGWDTSKVPYLMVGILLMAVPSVIESQLLPH